MYIRLMILPSHLVILLFPQLVSGYIPAKLVFDHKMFCTRILYIEKKRLSNKMVYSDRYYVVVLSEEIT